MDTFFVTLFITGHVIDLILIVMVVEAAVLLWLRRRSGRGLKAAELLSTLIPGACLLLAVRAALAGAAWVWIALALLAALLTHVVDVWRRWR